jgi:predicted  nucleic acid-binding Zn-ribbon protein
VRSRIQNLPNYKKTNLGENLQFIVVFQTIEIERLSQEIEVLRVRLKEYERQLFNSSNYEVQIRELTERCFAQEKEIYEYREEYEKLNKICETLYHENEMLKNKLSDIDFSLKQKYEAEKNRSNDLAQEIEKWKARYQAAEKSKAKELEDLRNMMESQRKSMIDREIREMTIRFQNERSSLENEIRKCRELL